MLAKTDLTTSFAPMSGYLGVQMVFVEDGVARSEMDWAEHLVGNPATGVLHGGAVTAMLDHTAGAAVHNMGDGIAIATVDLRIDYMRPAQPGERLYAEVRCVRRTRRVVFIHGIAHQGDPDRPVATATGTFMLAANRANLSGAVGTDTDGGQRPK